LYFWFDYIFNDVFNDSFGSMKRKHVEKFERLYKSRQFFWKKCEKCKQAFRREDGFRALTGPFLMGYGVWRYLCESCAPSVDVAHDYFLNKEWIPKRPKIFPKGQSAPK
jgi:hypothetical protein